METRRLVLLMIFSLSLIMLWDNYQASIGKPTLFGLSTGAQTSDKGDGSKGSGSSAGSGAANDLPQALAPTAGDVPADPNAIASGTAQAAPAAQTITVKTDVLELQFSSQGAQLITSKLLNHPAAENPELPVQLFEQTANRTYVGQAGLVGVPDAPNHRTLFELVSGSTEFAPGQDQLKLVFKATSGGVENTTTYTIFKNRYDIDLVINARNIGTEPVSPSAYVQITRDGNPLESDSS
ncbi:membrane protein insertase YidC, partial [Microcoleus sp. LEGE 07076]